MNTQTISRGHCLASQICKGSTLRPRPAAHLSSVQRLGQANAEVATPRGSTCSSRRHLTTTRAEAGNGANPAPSGLAIDLRGPLDSGSQILLHMPILTAHRLTRRVAAGKKAFIAGVADDQARGSLQLYYAGHVCKEGKSRQCLCRDLVGPSRSSWQRPEQKFHWVFG